MEKHVPQFSCLVPTKKEISLFIELSLFCFISVHTKLRRVGDYYIIIYTMKKNHFIWTSILKGLIGLL